MSLSHHQQRQMYRIETGLLRADPQLAEKLGDFGRLSAGERMPSWEHVDTRRDRIRQAAALVVEAFVLMAAAIRLLFGATRAVFAALVIGRRARLPQRSREQARPASGADDRPDPADWT